MRSNDEDNFISVRLLGYKGLFSYLSYNKVLGQVIFRSQFKTVTLFYVKKDLKFKCPRAKL